MADDKKHSPPTPMDPVQRVAHWDRQWHQRWSKAAPVGFEARIDPNSSGEQSHEFLLRQRTPQGERDRMNRIMQEFSRGFEQLYGLGPAVTVFGSSRFQQGTEYYALGVELAKGRRWADIEGTLAGVAEGAYTVTAALALATRLGVEMPIAQEVHNALFEGKSVQRCLIDLLSREQKDELAGVEEWARRAYAARSGSGV